MSEFKKTWEDGWPDRVELLVLKKGYSSITEYTRSHPTSTWIELAKRIDEHIAGIQIETLARHEALENSQMSLFAREALVRVFYRLLSTGWGVGENIEFRHAHCYASWSTSVGDDYDAQTDYIWDMLEKIGPEKGWLPDGPEDPLLLKAFEGISFDVDKS